MTSHIELTLGYTARMTFFQNARSSIHRVLGVKGIGGPHSGDIAQLTTVCDLFGAGPSPTNVVTALNWYLEVAAGGTFLERFGTIITGPPPFPAHEIGHDYVLYPRANYPFGLWAARMRTSTYDSEAGTFADDGHLIFYLNGAVMGTYTNISIDVHPTTALRVILDASTDVSRVWVCNRSLAPPVDGSGIPTSSTIVTYDNFSAGIDTTFWTSITPYANPVAGPDADPAASGLSTDPATTGFPQSFTPEDAAWRFSATLVHNYQISDFLVIDSPDSLINPCDAVRSAQSCLAEVDTPFDPPTACECAPAATSTPSPGDASTLVFTGFGDSDEMRFLSADGVDLGVPATHPQPGAGVDGIVTLSNGQVAIVGGGAPSFPTTGVGIFNADFTVAAEGGTGAHSVPGFSIARDDTSRFYGVRTGGGGFVMRYTAAGTQTGVWGPIGSSPVGVAVNGVGTIAYYVLSASRGVIRAWDLINDLSLGTFTTGATGFSSDHNALLAVSDGVVVGWQKGSTPGYLTHYSPAGAVLHTYPLSGTNPAPIVLTPGLTSSTIWVGYYLTADLTTFSQVTIEERVLGSGAVLHRFSPDDGSFEFDSSFAVLGVPGTVITTAGACGVEVRSAATCLAEVDPPFDAPSLCSC